MIRYYIWCLNIIFVVWLQEKGYKKLSDIFAPYGLIYPCVLDEQGLFVRFYRWKELKSLYDHFAKEF